MYKVTPVIHIPTPVSTPESRFHSQMLKTLLGSALGSCIWCDPCCFPWVSTPEFALQRRRIPTPNSGIDERLGIDVEAILEAILVSSWGTWEAFGGHVGRLGTNLSQHKAILSHLGANLRPPEANMTPTWANMSQHGAPGTFWMALKRSDTHRGSHN